jgi:hypothetical protein
MSDTRSEARDDGRLGSHGQVAAEPFHIWALSAQIGEDLIGFCISTWVPNRARKAMPPEKTSLGSKGVLNR